MSTPVKLRRRLKLATPATASAPYTTEAPPVRMSTRLSRASGMALVSTMPFRLKGTRRRPLSSTSVRLVPRPRRSIVAAPVVPLLVAGPIAGTAAGSALKNSSTATGCVARISSAMTDDIGLFELKPGAVMRVPVTSTTAVFCSWARAPAPLPMPIPASSALENIRRTDRDNTFSIVMMIFSLEKTHSRVRHGRRLTVLLKR